VRRRLFARIYAWIEPRMRRQMGQYREQLVADLDGRVLEIGCGTGANFGYYTAPATVTATDHSEHMLWRAREAAAAADVPIDVQAADVTRLPFEDGQFDAVVSALVLCSVPHPAAALAEMKRVLRPGGQLRIFEHVRSERGWVAAVQDVVTPLWRIPTDGCSLNRDTSAVVRESGFEIVSSERISLEFPHILLDARRTER